MLQLLLTEDEERVLALFEFMADDRKTDQACIALDMSRNDFFIAAKTLIEKGLVTGPHRLN